MSGFGPLSFPDDPGEKVQRRIVEQIADEGFVLEESGDLEAALRKHDQFIKKFGAFQVSAAILLPLARVMGGRSQVLEKMGRKREAVNAFSTVASRFDGHPDPRFEVFIANARLRAGVLLADDDLEEYSEAEEKLAELVGRHSSTASADVALDVLTGSFFRAVILAEQLNRRQDAVRGLKEVRVRFAEFPSQAVYDRTAELDMLIGRLERGDPNWGRPS